jgi:CRP/FNR family transcriptional regulator
VDKITLLSHINLLEELPMEEIETIDKMSIMKPVKKGTLILSPAHPIEALFFLKKGQVRLYRMNSQGKQFTTDILVDGNIFGETSSFSLTDDQMYVEAMTDTYLCTMGKEEFESFVEKNPKMAVKLINILAARLKDTYDISEKIALGDVKYRVLYLLHKLSEKSGKRKKEWQTIEMKITHSDIATMVGSTRETVSALMSQFRKDGLLKKGLLSYALHVDNVKEKLEIT